MAGGFDGMGVSTRGATNRATHSTRGGVMGVRLKESTQGVDNLYKYLINKEIFMDQLNFQPSRLFALLYPAIVCQIHHYH